MASSLRTVGPQGVPVAPLHFVATGPAPAADRNDRPRRVSCAPHDPLARCIPDPARRDTVRRARRRLRLPSPRREERPHRHAHRGERASTSRGAPRDPPGLRLRDPHPPRPCWRGLVVAQAPFLRTITLVRTPSPSRLTVQMNSVLVKLGCRNPSSSEPRAKVRIHLTSDTDSG